MAEEKIVVEIDENGELKAETFGLVGPICMEKLDKLLKDFDGGDNEKKPDYYKHPTISPNTKQTVGNK